MTLHGVVITSVDRRTACEDRFVANEGQRLAAEVPDDSDHPFTAAGPLHRFLLQRKRFGSLSGNFYRDNQTGSGRTAGTADQWIQDFDGNLKPPVWPGAQQVT